MSRLFDKLRDAGCDPEAGTHRLMNNEELYCKYLRDYPPYSTEIDFEGDYRRGDRISAEKHAHILKGLTGNLSLDPLHKAYSKVVDSLRKGIGDYDELAQDAIELEHKLRDIIENSDK